LSKSSQVGSCFEVFIARNPMVRSKFNFDVCSVIYRFFFSFNQCCIWLMSSILFSFACMHSNPLSHLPSATQREFVAQAIYKSTPAARRRCILGVLPGHPSATALPLSGPPPPSRRSASSPPLIDHRRASLRPPTRLPTAPLRRAPSFPSPSARRRAVLPPCATHSARAPQLVRRPRPPRPWPVGAPHQAAAAMVGTPDHQLKY
jgi:hypothetical protein